MCVRTIKTVAVIAGTLCLSGVMFYLLTPEMSWVLRGQAVLALAAFAVIRYGLCAVVLAGLYIDGS